MKKLTILIILSAIICCGLKAQSTIETTDNGAIIINVDIKKPKAIQKLLKDKDLNNVKKIKVNGPVTEKDIQFIFSSLINLEALDMSSASLPLTYEYPKKSGNIYNKDSFVLPSSSKVTKLGIPSSCITLFNKAQNNFEILIGANLKMISGVSVDVNVFICNYDILNYSNYDRYFYETVSSINFSPKIITNTDIPLFDIYIHQEHIGVLPFKTKAIINKDANSTFKNGSFSTRIDDYKYNIEQQCYKYRTNKRSKKATTFALITYSIDNLRYDVGFGERRYIIEDGIEPVFLILYGKKYISLANYDGLSSNNKAHVKLSDYEKYIDRIDEIEPYAFYGHSEITDIDLNVKGLNYIGAYAFAGTNFTSITIPESITQISPYAFDGSSIKDVIIESIYPPVIEEKYEKISENHKEKNILEELIFIIPENSREKYNIGAWKNLHIREAGVKTDYELFVEMPGTLNQFINDDNAPNITNLVIKGFLDDRDFEAIRKCKNLQKLDLSHCFTIISEQTQKAEKEKTDAEIALVSFILNASHDEAKRQYEVGTATLGDVVSTYAMKEDINKFVEAYDKKEFVADKNCKMPFDALSGLTVLKEFMYPLQLQSACVSMPKSVEKVILPPYATKIGGFGGCKNIKNLSIPSTVSSISGFTLHDCVFDELDLSNTQITEFPEGSFYKSEIGTFKAPKGLLNVCDFNCDRWGCNDIKVNKVYFYTQEPPRCLTSSKMKVLSTNLRKYEVHIPRGTKAGWIGEFGDLLIDDILE